MLETDLRATPEILRVRVSPKHIKKHQNTSKNKSRRAWADWCGNLEGFGTKIWGIHRRQALGGILKTRALRRTCNRPFFKERSLIEVFQVFSATSVCVDTVPRSKFVFSFLVPGTCIFLFGYTVHSRVVG